MRDSNPPLRHSTPAACLLGLLASFVVTATGCERAPLETPANRARLIAEMILPEARCREVKSGLQAHVASHAEVDALYREVQRLRCLQRDI